MCACESFSLRKVVLARRETLCLRLVSELRSVSFTFFFALLTNMFFEHSPFMFARRVFSSAGLPRAMWSTMHVQSATQAARMLPMFTPLSNAPCKAVAMSQLVAGLNSVAIASAAELNAMGLLPIEAIVAQLLSNPLSLLTIFHCSMTRYPPIQKPDDI